MRSREEVQASRNAVLEAKGTVIARYRLGDSMALLAREYQVNADWLAARFDEWGEPRRDRSAAAVVRGPGVPPMPRLR